MSQYMRTEDLSVKYAKILLALSALAAGAPVTAARAADDVPWTLESAIAWAIGVAPEIRAAGADVAARRGELTQARSYPNPTVELRADDKLGQEDGGGGTDLTALAVSQPLPIRRVARERRVAEARLGLAEQDRRLRRLELEREVARVFHGLQLTQAKLALARERVAQTDTYPGVAARAAGERLIRYLAPLDRARLAVLHEETHQAVSTAEREHEQALIALRTRLVLPPQAAVEVVALAEPPAVPALDALERNLESHPALVGAQRAQEAAEAGIAAAQSQRFADPALNLFRERDFLNNARRDVTGVGVSVQMPVWNANPGVVDRARAEAVRARTEYEIAVRDAAARLRRAHAELARTRAQAEQLRASLLAPAQRVNALARRSFAAGEANVLALIDAANSYFDAQARHAELLAQAQEAQAELRIAAGQSVSGAEERP